jgi:SAM-dependent methyltransferase
MSLAAATFSDQIFNVSNLAEAKRIILTQESNLTPDQRWLQETPHLVNLIITNIDLNPNSLVLDFGCGVGRLPKELISHSGCRCVGVDTSDSMLSLSVAYCCSDRYLACRPAMLKYLKLSFDLTLSIWALQHVHHLQQEIDTISNGLRPGGKLFIVNEKRRVLPTAEGFWADDGLDIRRLLSRSLTLVKEGKLNPAVAAKGQSERTFWAIYEKRGMTKS